MLALKVQSNRRNHGYEPSGAENRRTSLGSHVEWSLVMASVNGARRYLFDNFDQAREAVRRFLIDYNARYLQIRSGTCCIGDTIKILCSISKMRG